MNVPSASARLLRAAIGRAGPIEPSEADWNAWVEFAKEQRVLPLLYRICTFDAAELSGRQLDAMTAIQVDVMATMVRFEQGLLELAEVLSDNQLDFAVLKGAATAHLDYDSPEMRQFGDVDALVSPNDFARAVAVLNEHDWTQAYPLPRHHDRFTHATTLRSSRRVEVDLHQRIAHRSIGLLIPTDDLLEHTVEYEIAGQSLRALSQHDRLIHAAIHSLSSRGPYSRLSSTCDTLVLAEAATGSARAVLDRADSWRVRLLVERAIGSAYLAAQLPIHEAWLTASECPQQHRDRLAELAYLSERRRPVLEELAFLRLMPSWHDRSDYVRGYFATDTEYSRRRHRSGLTAQCKYLWSRVRSR